MKTVNFVRNAEDVKLVKNYGTNHSVLTVEGTDVELDRRHPITTAASLTSADNIVDSLKGGHYVIEQWDDGSTHLKEWRDSTYKGFMQTDDFIERFGHDESLTNKAFGDFQIDEFGEGGLFDITTGFEWSAFNKNLKTQVSILRQICSNGMVAKSPMFEREVPIINLFDHHLSIAARQLVDITVKEIKSRLSKMAREHAYMKDVDLIHTHIQRRLKKDPFNKRLNAMDKCLNMYGDATKYYKEQAISSGITKALPSPISTFDLWNITTELNSHTQAEVESTSSSLNRIATGLIFPKHIGNVMTDMNLRKSPFGSPEQAFFGA